MAQGGKQAGKENGGLGRCDSLPSLPAQGLTLHLWVPPQPTAAALPTLYEPDLGEAHSKGILGPQAVPRLVFFLHTVGSQGLSPAHALWRLGSCLPHSAPSMPTAGLPWGQTLPEGH